MRKKIYLILVFVLTFITVSSDVRAETTVNLPENIKVGVAKVAGLAKGYPWIRWTPLASESYKMRIYRSTIVGNLGDLMESESTVALELNYESWVDDNGIEKDKIYYYTFQVEDDSGNLSVYSEQYKLENSIDLEIESFGANARREGVEIYWQTNKPTTAIINIRNDDDPSQLDLSYNFDSLGANGSVTTPKILKIGQNYSFQIVVYDEHDKYRVNTLRGSCYPLIEPVISDIQLDVKAKEATINWKTDIPATSGFSYERADIHGPFSLMGGNEELTTNHIVALVNLEPSTEYRYMLESRDANGYIAVTGLKYFTTSDLYGMGFLDQEKSLVKVVDKKLTARLKGRILLQVEEKGESWYVNPIDERKYYLGRPSDALDIMRKLGLGTSNSNLEGIPVGVTYQAGALDTDGDGLSDSLEKSLGLAETKSDTDGDGHSDYDEVSNDYYPKGAGKLNIDYGLVEKLRGRILLQVESQGQAWYINPVDNRRYYLGRPADAFNIMRGKGLGITNDNLRKIEVGETTD